MNKAEKISLLQNNDFIFVLAGKVYPGNAIAMNTNEELQTVAVSQADYEQTKNVTFTADGRILDGNGDVIHNYLDVVSVDVTTDETTRVTTINAKVQSFEVGATATVKIIPDPSLALDDIVHENVTIDQDGLVSLDVGELPNGTHTAVVTVKASSKSAWFVVELDVLPVVVSVTDVADKTKAFGESTDVAILAELPSTITATLDDEAVVTLTVDWEADENYSEHVAGEYTFTGGLVPDVNAQYTIPAAFATIELVVTVEAPTPSMITAAINAVNAANAATIIDALQNPVLGLIEVDETLGVKYVAEILASVTNTVARIQQAVDRVNDQAALDDQDAINDVNAALNFGDLRIALGLLGIQNVAPNPMFNQQYFDAIDANPSTTKAEIQTIINAVNFDEVTAVVVEAETELTQLAHNTANALVILDLLETVAQTDVEDRLVIVQQKINIETAIQAVNTEASLAVNAANLLAALQALYVADNTFTFDTVAEIQNFVNDVNTDKATGLVDAAILAVNAEISAAVNAANLLAALQAGDLALTNVLPANQAAYGHELEAQYLADNTFLFDTILEIQQFVNGVNVEEAIDVVNNEIGAIVVPATLLTALQDPILDLGQIVPRNRQVYALELGELYDADHAFQFETKAAIQAFVIEANMTPVGRVNTAKNTTQSRTALENPALDLDLAVYDALSPLQKNLVAQAIRANGTNFTDADSVQVELDATILAL